MAPGGLNLLYPIYLVLLQDRCYDAIRAHHVSVATLRSLGDYDILLGLIALKSMVKLGLNYAS